MPCFIGMGKPKAGAAVGYQACDCFREYNGWKMKYPIDMGKNGLPAAIGAKLANPQKDVIVVSGDGGMQMNIQEMATAIVYELPIIICIFNNGYLGNVRQWQEMFYDRCYSGTCMRYRKSCETGCNTRNKCCPEYTPDFVRLAESYGAKGIRVTKAQEIETALTAAKENKKMPTVIEFIIDREMNVMPIVPPGNALEDMILENT